MGCIHTYTYICICTYNLCLYANIHVYVSIYIYVCVLFYGICLGYIIYVMGGFTYIYIYNYRCKLHHCNLPGELDGVCGIGLPS